MLAADAQTHAFIDADRRGAAPDVTKAATVCPSCGAALGRVPEVLSGMRQPAGRRRRRRPLSRRGVVRQPLPDRRGAWPRWDGRGLPRARPRTRSTGGAQIPFGAPVRRAGASAAAQRGAAGAAARPSQRVPRLRHRRGARRVLSVDGVRGRRGPGRAAEAHRAATRGQGDRHRAEAVRRLGGRARQRRAAPRLQTGQHHDRRRWGSSHHGLRAGGDLERARRERHSQRHAGLHGAGATSGPRSDGAERSVCARPRALRTLHRSNPVRRPRPRRTPAPARVASVHDAGHAHPGVGAPRREGDPGVSGAGSRFASRIGAGGFASTARRRPLGRSPCGRRDSIAGAGRVVRADPGNQIARSHRRACHHSHWPRRRCLYGAEGANRGPRASAVFAGGPHRAGPRHRPQPGLLGCTGRPGSGVPERGWVGRVGHSIDAGGCGPGGVERATVRSAVSDFVLVSANRDLTGAPPDDG